VQFVDARVPHATILWHSMPHWTQSPVAPAYDRLASQRRIPPTRRRLYHVSPSLADAVSLTGARGGHGINLHSLKAKGAILVGRLRSINGSSVSFANDLNQSIQAADKAKQEFVTSIDAFIRDQGIDAPEVTSDNTDDGLPSSGGPYPVIGAINLVQSGISTIIWATGFACDFGWIDFPVLDKRGFPLQSRGVTALPGLYFCGQHWLHSFASGGLNAIGDDPGYIASHIHDRATKG